MFASIKCLVPMHTNTNHWSGTTLCITREVELVNGFIIYKQKVTNKTLSPSAFREKVIDGLLDTWQAPKVRQGRPSTMPTPLRMTGSQFTGKYDDKKYKPDYAVCSDRRNKKRVQTSYYCKKCQVPLCVLPCFERYHTSLNYKAWTKARIELIHFKTLFFHFIVQISCHLLHSKVLNNGWINYVIPMFFSIIVTIAERANRWKKI